MAPLTRQFVDACALQGCFGMHERVAPPTGESL